MKFSSSLSNLLWCARCAPLAGIRNYSTTASGKGRPRRGLICQPILSEGEEKDVKRVTSLHFGSSYISWVTLEVGKTEISQMGIASFPEGFEKMNLPELSSFALQSFRMLPKANYYIMEEGVKAVSGTAGRSQLMFQSTQMQYVAMLIALINFEADAAEGHQNKVLLIKHKLPARLFGLLVGSEIVSSTRIINDILNNNAPQRFTPLQYSNNLKSEYFSKSRIEREVIGFSLMTAVTFLELVVQKNKKCYEFVGLSSVVSNMKKSEEKVA